VTITSNNLPIWQVTNAWREILARIFADFPVELNITPEWLVNPATHRRLKLDLLYPEIGVAVRFEGQQGKQHRQRPSLEEEEQQQIRDLARLEVCRAHGIELIVVDVTGDTPKANFQNIDLSLSQVKRGIKSRKLIDKIGQARATAATLARRLATPADLKLYADLWQDRQYQLAEPNQPARPAGDMPAFSAGMEVEHVSFGRGVILAISPNNGDALITVDFVTAGQKTFMASLVANKLWPK
jgi:hypothetical protein